MYHFLNKAANGTLKTIIIRIVTYCIDDETDTFLRVQWFPIIHLHRKQLRTAERIEPVDQITEEHTRNGSRHDIRNEVNPR